jgi:hypothetical protein
MDAELKTILLTIVNDLEKSAAQLTVLTNRVQQLAPTMAANYQDALQAAARTNAAFYAGLRKKIEAL